MADTEREIARQVIIDLNEYARNIDVEYGLPIYDENRMNTMIGMILNSFMARTIQPELIPCCGYMLELGAFNLGEPKWVQCKKPATLFARKTDPEGSPKRTTFPVCASCAKKAIDAGAEIITIDPQGDEMP
jgi:hypothetical protein